MTVGGNTWLEILSIGFVVGFLFEIAESGGFYAGEGVALSPDGRYSALNYAFERVALYLVEGLR